MPKKNPGSGDGKQKPKRKGDAGDEYSVDNQDPNDPNFVDDDDDTDDGDEGKTFTQEDLDRIVKERLKKEKAKTDRALSEKKALLERLRDSETASKEEKEDLQSQITALEEANMSEKEIAERRISQATKEREKELAAERAEKDRLKGLLIRNEKRNVLLEAATNNNAYDPDQVFGLLANRLQVEELKDDVSGKPLGKFSHKLVLPVEQDDGTMEDQEFSIKDGVKHYMDKHPNLIKDNFGGGGAGTEVGTIDTEGNRVMKESDIAKLSDEDFEKQLGDILDANADGRIRIGQ